MSGNSKRILAAAEFVKQADRVIREGQFDRGTAGSEMLKRGYALMFGTSLEVADRAIRSMLAMCERSTVGAQRGKSGYESH